MTQRTKVSRQYWHNVFSPGGITTVPRWTINPSSKVFNYEEKISNDLFAGLQSLAKESALSLETLLLASHAKVLAALSGEANVTTGYVLDSDDQVLPCRMAIKPGSWRDMLRAIHDGLLEMQLHSEFPIEELAKELNVTEQAFETIFCSTAKVGPLDKNAVLSVSYSHIGEALTFHMEYLGEALDAPSAERISGYHLKALTLMVADSDAEHSKQCLLSSEELHYQIEGLTGAKIELPEARLHELFEQRALKQPDTIAGVCGNIQWTYGELNERANRLGHSLLAYGLDPEKEQVVAVVTERNLDWLASVLAIFKAGGVYLPIEPHFPTDRIARMLTRAECKLALSETGSDTSLDQAIKNQPSFRKLLIADAYKESHQTDNLGIEVGFEQAAYIFFTSGSTGEPKGALCQHDGMINHVLAKIEDFGIEEGQTVTQIAPQCFDISLWQLATALLVGGTTHIIEREAVLDVQRFVETIVSGEVSVMQVVPSYLDVLLSYLEENQVDLPHLHCVSVTGEAISKELAVRWFAARPTIKLANAYGLTETSDDTNHEVMERPPTGKQVPLGPCVRNAYVYVVDENLSPVPLGAPGEIVFSGVCVSRCYINDPERSSKAFVADPLRKGERMYRSGDFGRWSPDEKLEFLGRQDSQVKIRGFRVEIGDIENALLHADGVSSGAVIINEHPNGSKQLIAFYSGANHTGVDLMESSLAQALPEYMVPSIFHWQETLPLTANGKIDKKRLTALAAELNDSSGTYEAPTTPSEQKVASVWAKVLEVDANTVNRQDNFFDQGGTSLSAIKLVIGLERKVTIKDVANHSVLADLAALFDAGISASDIKDPSL